MFRDVVTADTSLEEWEWLRARIHQKISDTMGQSPKSVFSGTYSIVDRSVSYGLEMQNIRFEPLPGMTTYGTIALSPELKAALPAPAALCIHGTDHRLAHLNMLSPDEKPRRQYGIELARRGFVSLAVDQFGFGEGNKGRTEKELIGEFYEAYPKWSVDGIRLHVQRCALDVLSGMAQVDANRLACIGNSLGGRAAIYLAAFDKRVKAAVVSTGISPNLTNLFRNYPRPESLSPMLDRRFAQSGTPPFEYQELIALVAPRGLLLLEPWNDTYNPMIEPVLRCFEKARFVYALHGKPEKLQIVCHGDGHDTRDEVRVYAYAMIERFLGL